MKAQQAYLEWQKIEDSNWRTGYHNSARWGACGQAGDRSRAMGLGKSVNCEFVLRTGTVEEGSFYLLLLFIFNKKVQGGNKNN